ncbi:MAG: biotin--[acetyl-CoA-carboxylase] ligase [Rhodoferax sp.]|uniref:biotin--[acetyl-CoA-carboxylase] ligase n=1 Tax=Rhodoferax sp. TaxID=50421 RepID=UPI00262CC74A|nr:biotin--[acetyl-CoA-carboxylase] ligase [Rhodoferax sp.]MDD2880566.1 biotin--[acetyl-CoA-carboxylase] ligase [Rhodoferax sp.]
MMAPVRWPSEDIWEAVAPLLPGFTVEVLPEVDSTNSELMRRARAGCLEPVLLVTERQTAGRGRLGRQWLSGAVARGFSAEPSEGETVPLGGSAAHAVARVGAMSALTFSLGLSLAPADWSGLSLAVGLSVAQSLHPDIRLKWPNDLWWHDRKLAGILIETANWGEASAIRYVVIGIGVNIRTPVVDGLSTEPVGLEELLPDLSAPQALGRIAANLVQAVQTFEARGFAPFQAKFNALDALAQLPVTLSDGLQGVALGVDTSGALLVAAAQGVQRVTSAEVSVRLQPGPSYADL